MSMRGSRCMAHSGTKVTAQVTRSQLSVVQQTGSGGRGSNPQTPSTYILHK
jgi:hypothetical protein